MPLVRICGGGVQRWAFLLRLRFLCCRDIAPRRHPRERRERHARLPDALRSDFGEQSRVDTLPRCCLRCRGGASPLSEGHDEPAAVLLVDGAGQVAAGHQSVDELARSLLRDPQVSDESSERDVLRPECQATDDIEAVLGDVAVASFFERVPHSGAVGGAGMSEQRGKWDRGWVKVWVRHGAGDWRSMGEKSTL